jgi:hypothetical protein
MRTSILIHVLGTALLAAALAFAGAWKVEAAAAKTDPASFMERVVRLVAANRYGQAWDLLDPRQQAVVPRSAYIQCERLTPIPGRLASIERRGVYDELVQVPGTDEPTAAKAVRLRLVITGVMRVSITHTFHAAFVDGAWRWYLPASRFAAYAAGYCTGMEPPPAPSA